MFGALAKYLATRAVDSATEGLVRKVSWGGAAAVFGLIGLITFAFVAFWWLERRYSREAAGLIIVIGSFILAAIAALMPSMIDWMQRPAAKNANDGAAQVVSTAVEEAHDAVDYLGPMRLVASAFMVGLGLGRRVRHR